MPGGKHSIVDRIEYIENPTPRSGVEFSLAGEIAKPDRWE